MSEPTQLPSVNLLHRPTLATMRQLDTAGAEAARTETSLIFEAMVERAARPKIRQPAYFDGRLGFDDGHLANFKVPLPTPLGERARDVTPIGGDASGRLDYTHFSIVMSGSRRIAMMTAVNIEGMRSVSIERDKDKWFLDGRIPTDLQVGEALYAGNRLDRGHLVRREDPNWGPNAQQANDDTFHFTNCAPQIDIVNQQTWLGLENYILQNARTWKERCSVFTGPVFGRNDIEYRGVGIPKAFWKVVAFLSDEGKPSATAYMVSQEEELSALEAAFGEYKTYQRSIRFIERTTGISFGELANYDGFSNEEELTGLALSQEIRALGQIRV